MAAARCDQIGVALTQADAIIRQAKSIGEDLRKRRLVTLADGLRAGDQRNGPVAFEPDIDVLVRRAAGSLDVIRKSETTQTSAPLAVGASCREAWKVSLSKRTVECLGEMPAVNHETQ